MVICVKGYTAIKWSNKYKFIPDTNACLLSVEGIIALSIDGVFFNTLAIPLPPYRQALGK